MNKSIFFGWQEVEQVYQSIKTNNITLAVWTVAMAIAVVVLIVKGGKTLPKLIETETGTIDVRAFITAMLPFFYGFLVIIALPVIISTAEAAFSYIEQATMNGIGAKQPKSISDALSQELAEKFANGGAWGLMTMDITEVFDFIGILVFKPLFAMIDQWMFAGALAYRYMYLLMLELIAPIAVVGLISKSTESWFYQWCKNMLACYLLIPAFLLAISFGEGLKGFLVTDGGITTFALFMVVVIKFGLIKQATSMVFKLF